MGFNRFRFYVLLRVIILFITVATFVFLIFFDRKYVTTVVTGFLILFEVFELFNYIENTNKKLRRFFDAIKYNDFNMSFTHDNKLGKTFKELNLAFKDVIDAILVERKKSEQSFQQLRVIVENIGTGIIAINEIGEIKLINRAALNSLKVESLRSLDDLRTKVPLFASAIEHLNSTKRAIFKNEYGQELAILETKYKLGGDLYRLIAFQDIKAELQAKELEAWQNLTKVLRHEIMNSIAPISSLTSTLSEVLREDVSKINGQNIIGDESLEDLTEGLSTISGRSEGLINFVNAYRDYTNLPEPVKRVTDLNQLIHNTVSLLKNDFIKSKVILTTEFSKNKILLNIDYQLIEQVLINLLKNALEVVVQQKNGHVSIQVHQSSDAVMVSVIDNGSGITDEAKEKIFMPFFSTKNRGSGIGLSLSKQIMQLHGGDIQVETALGNGSTFSMIFNYTPIY
jgi:nitrogen fixation/metabolism regulation signal transduction histidine kinase